MSGVAERCIRVAVRDLVGGNDVGTEIAPRETRARQSGVTAIGDRRQRLVVDVHECGRIFGYIAVLGRHQRDGFADIGDFARAQRIRPHRLARLTALARLAHHAPLRQRGHEIVKRQYGVHAGKRAPCAPIDLIAACACVLRTNATCKRPGGGCRRRSGPRPSAAADLPGAESANRSGRPWPAVSTLSSSSPLRRAPPRPSALRRARRSSRRFPRPSPD